MTQEIEYVKVLHCPNDDGKLVNLDDCMFCDYYEDIHEFDECVICKCPKVME
jgi:hypothetical protein